MYEIICIYTVLNASQTLKSASIIEPIQPVHTLYTHVQYIL